MHMKTENSDFERWLDNAMKEYRKTTMKSARAHQQAQQFLPGGDTRSVTFFDPYPLFVKEGQGCRFVDLDGNVYVDFVNNYTSLVHGHAHPAIVEAVSAQMKKGFSFASPMTNQRELAQMICERVKSVETIRFCNSGTEATMNAIRAARIFTGRSKIAKMEGGYHGTHDAVEVSFNPCKAERGPASSPNSVPESTGIPQSVADEVVVLPFNDKEHTDCIVREHGKDIACIIVEPMLGASGCILPEDGYLDLLRRLCDELDIVLIFDEVVTFRLAPGGLQTTYGIQPDITAFGKVIGGGLPVGAFGGRRDIMSIFSPMEEKHNVQSGTFNANPITMTAGIQSLRLLSPDAIGRINTLGAAMRNGINAAFKHNGIRSIMTGIGSLGHIHFNAQTVRDYRTASVGHYNLMRLVHLKLLQRGLNVPPRGGELSISTVMGQQEVDLLIEAFDESLAEIKSLVEGIAPELVG
jgi:glutamate-1-semialdehyde 2,1-aminomutase